MKVHTLSLLLAILAVLSCMLVSSMDGAGGSSRPPTPAAKVITAPQKASDETLEAAKDGDFEAIAVVGVASGVFHVVIEHHKLLVRDTTNVAGLTYDIGRKIVEYAKTSGDYVSVLNNPVDTVGDRSTAKDSAINAKSSAENAKRSFFRVIGIVEGIHPDVARKYYAKSVRNDVAAAKKYLDYIGTLIKGNPDLRSERLSATIDKVNAVITKFEKVETPIEDRTASDARDCAISARSACIRALDALVDSSCVDGAGRSSPDVAVQQGYDDETRKILEAARSGRKHVREILGGVHGITGNDVNSLLKVITNAAKATESAVTAVASGTEANKVDHSAAIGARNRAKKQEDVIKAQVDIAKAVSAVVGDINEAKARAKAAGYDHRFEVRAFVDVVSGVIYAVEDDDQSPDDARVAGIVEIVADINDEAGKYANAARDHADAIRRYIDVVNNPTGTTGDRDTAESRVAEARHEANAALRALNGAREIFEEKITPIEEFHHGEIIRYYAECARNNIAAAKNHLNDIDDLIVAKPNLISGYPSATIWRRGVNNDIKSDIDKASYYTSETRIKEYTISNARDRAIDARKACLRASHALACFRSGRVPAGWNFCPPPRVASS